MSQIQTLFDQALAFQDTGKLDAAVAAYDQVLALKPGLPEALFNRGNALKDLGRYDDALASYGKALALQPANLDAKRNIFWLHFIRAKNTALIDRLAVEIWTDLAKIEAANLSARKTMQDFRVLHDLEQTGYLIENGYAGNGLAAAHGALRGVYGRCQAHNQQAKAVALGDSEIGDINRFRGQVLRYAPQPVARALNPGNDWAAIEARYFASVPEIVAIDDLLSPEALIEIRKYCLISNMWKLEFKNQYLGVLAEGGFVSALHMQIAAELREKMPRIFGAHMLEQLWAFKYTSRLGSGINVHADYARVNLNFWVTPDAANLDPATGGLTVYEVPAPLEWGFEEYNKNDSGGIYAFLDASRAGKRTVPYRCNRAVLFNSRLFHETDAIRFKEGYENRRINITYLFGRGLGAR